MKEMENKMEAIGGQRVGLINRGRGPYYLVW